MESYRPQFRDGRPVIDSSVICEYLEEIAPKQGTSLMPSTAIGRAKVRAWLRYIEEVPTAAVRASRLFNALLPQRMAHE